MHKRYYALSNIYYLNVAVVSIWILTFQAYDNGRFSGTENILLALFIISIFMLDGWVQKFQSLICGILLLYLKSVRMEFDGYAVDQSIALIVINTGVLLILIYALLRIFKSIYLNSISTVKDGESLLYTLIDNIPIYVGIYDSTGRYSMVNVLYEGAFNLKRQDIIGKTMAEIIPDENIPKYQPLLDKALAGETVEFHNKTPMLDGQEIVADGKYVPVFDENGKVKYVTVTLYDVTKTEKLLEELRQANNSKNKLFNIVAHDLKSPFSNFEILLNSLEDDLIDKQTLKEYTKLLRAKFTPLNQTVRELLEWSMLQLDGINAKKEKFDLAPQMEEIIQSFQAPIDKKQIKVSKDLKVSEVYFDKDHLTIILRNLINNAVKFTPVGGSIHMMSEQTDNHICMAIKDSGIGMAQDKIMEITSGGSVDSSLGTDGEKGTGLGLMFCQELLKKNGGKLEVESELGVGTEFKLHFDSN
ncbi:MAG: PAS domain-containing sensor histidine kinase [bacterium]|nr:PAS domain-containing sensor histidine kinase [bacterium]